MIRYLKKFNLPENPELLLMLLIGICLQVTDGSPFSLKYRWRLVWDIELPGEYFSLFAQKIIKTILAIIIIVRCSTTYAYVVSAMLVIFCLLKKSTPKLMILWLLVAGVKSICMTFAEAIAGVYVCSAFGKIRRPCIEFFISKALEIIFAAYLWGNVLSIYQDMENKAKDGRNLPANDEVFSSFIGQRARSLIDESTLYKTACLNNFEFKDVPQIILQMLRRDDEMSEDSLLGPGMMLASVSNLGSFDNLKTSQSLGELGFMDLGSTEIVGLEEDENLSYRDKVLKFLKLTRSDVAKIKSNKTRIESDIFIVEDDIWARMMASGTHINKPKQTRTEVFIREIPFSDENLNKTERQRKGALKFDISFSNLFVGMRGEFQDDQDEEDSLILSQDEEEGKEDDEIVSLFMSNIKEGILIRRFGLGFGIRIMKENRYEKLYRQDFMSKIGPEVFERATNLPKVTSFTKIMRNSVSLPEILQTNRKSNISREGSIGKVDQTSNLDLYSKEQEIFRKQIFCEESCSEEETENMIEKNSTEEISMDGQLQAISEKIEYEEKAENESGKSEENEIIIKNSVENFELTNVEDKICFPSPNLSVADLNKVKELKPCFRKRRILIKRTGNRSTTQSQKVMCDSLCSSRNSTDDSDKPSSQTQFGKESAENFQQSNTTLSKHENNSRYSFNTIDCIPSSLNESKIYILRKILEKPHRKLSIPHFDPNKNKTFQEKVGLWSHKTLDTFNSAPREEKVWKSNVLKTVETCFLTKYPQTVWSRKDSKTFEFSDISTKSKSSLENEVELSSGFTAPDHDGLFTLRVRSLNLNTEQDFEGVSKELGKEICQNFVTNSEISDSFTLIPKTSEYQDENSNFLTSENSPELTPTKKSHMFLYGTYDFDSLSSKAKISKIETDETKTQGKIATCKVEMEKKIIFERPSEVLDKEDSFCSQESEEPISLYYSKAANLASPLLDMRRFIYPDHIHYSYKHVNKEGFDVNINGGLPLLVGENLPSSTPLNKVNECTSKIREPKIKRRPMDLSFATTNAFADWQNNYSNDLEIKENQTINSDFSTRKESESSEQDFFKKVRAKKMKYLKKFKEKKETRVSNGFSKPKSKPKSFCKNFNDFKFMYSIEDYVLIEKLLRMHMQFHKNEFLDLKSKTNERAPIQISSTQLHSNKGRKNSIKNPAIFLQKNKSKNEKKKIDTQEERTKDMFARLASEAFLQNSNMFTSSGSKRNI